MADGFGAALGVGAEAFSGAFQGAQDYKLALAQQQMQAGTQAERTRLAQERQDFEQERTNLLNQQTQFALTQAKEEAKRAEEIRAEAKEFRELTFPDPSGADITASVASGKASDIGKEVKKIRKKRLTAKFFPETLKPEDERESIGSDFQVVQTDRGFVQINKITGESTLLEAGGEPLVKTSPTAKDLTTDELVSGIEIKRVQDIVKQSSSKDLDDITFNERVNRKGRKIHKDKWIDQEVPFKITTDTSTFPDTKETFLMLPKTIRRLQRADLSDDSEVELSKALRLKESGDMDEKQFEKFVTELIKEDRK